MSTATASAFSLFGTLNYPAIERQQRSERIEEWVEKLQPDNPLEHWLVGRAATISLEIERLEGTESEVRHSVLVRAENCWDTDRNIEAEELALKLHKKPGAISRKLRGFKQGAEWLLYRWAALRTTLDLGNDWNDAQRSLALDLLGISETERTGPTMIDLPPSLGPEHLIPIRRELANHHMNALDAEISGPLNNVDKQERRQTTLGHSAAKPGTALASIRREIAAATRQLRWTLDTFYKVRMNYFAAIEPSNESKPMTEAIETDLEEPPDQNEPNLPDEMPLPTLSIGSNSSRLVRNRRARRAMSRMQKRQRA